jgi:hypothetical protein
MTGSLAHLLIVRSHCPLLLCCRRRLELFGEDHNIREGWVTVGRSITQSTFKPQVRNLKEAAHALQCAAGSAVCCRFCSVLQVLQCAAGCWLLYASGSSVLQSTLKPQVGAQRQLHSDALQGNTSIARGKRLCHVSSGGSSTQTT